MKAFSKMLTFEKRRSFRSELMRELRDYQIDKDNGNEICDFFFQSLDRRVRDWELDWEMEEGKKVKEDSSGDFDFENIEDLSKEDIRKVLADLIVHGSGNEKLKATDMLSKLDGHYEKQKASGIVFEQVKYGGTCDACEFDFKATVG